MNIRVFLIMTAVVLSLSACGGGGGDGGGVIPGTVTPPLAAGVYKLTFTAISTARLEAPISGIDVAVKFPVGLSVSTITGGTGQIRDSSITSGNAVQAGAYVFGNYSASTRTAYLTMSTTLDSYRTGQFLNLLFTVPSGSSVTSADIFTLNSTYKKYKVVGLNTITHSTVVMTDKVKTTLGVVQ